MPAAQLAPRFTAQGVGAGKLRVFLSLLLITGSKANPLFFFFP